MEENRRNNNGKAKLGSKVKTVWSSLRENFKAVTKKFEDKWLPEYGSAATMVYQVWPGNNVFLFHGRLICGPDPRGLLLTSISVIFSSLIFAIDTDGLPCNSRPFLVISLILTIIVLVNLFIVNASDPGIIPRNDQVAEEETPGSNDGIRRKRVVINGVQVKLKYCQICKIFSLPRSCHCAICNNCVDKYDHHCPWIGQCVGLRNYRFYLMFVSSALVLFVYLFGLSCWKLHKRVSQNGCGLFHVLISRPGTVALMTFSVAAICFLSCLVVFHLYLLAINQTSYEHVRQCYMSRRNPFDEGVTCNIKEVLFAPFLPSSVNFRAEIVPSGSSSVVEDVN